MQDLDIKEFLKNSNNVNVPILILATTHLDTHVINRISGVMVSVLAFRAVEHGFDSRSGHTKDYNIAFAASTLST